MGEAALQPDLLTVDEYHDLEERSDVRHEYWNGYVRAMAGGEPAHAWLIAGVAQALNERLKGKSCRATTSEVAVSLQEQNAFVYPDIVVWCKDADFDKKYPKILRTPLIIVEVLSPSTSWKDRGAKLQAYLGLPSLTDYLILSPERVSIEHFSRGHDGAWPYRHYVLRSQTIRLGSLGLEVSVDELYAELDVPESSGLTLGIPFDEQPENSG